MRLFTCVAIGMLLAAPVLAADAPVVQEGSTTSHSSACTLAEAIAGKLGYKGKVKHETAEQTCRALTPKMSEQDGAEFMRCCLQRLESGGDAPAAKPKSQKRPDSAP
jgi:hypothetical protein